MNRWISLVKITTSLFHELCHKKIKHCLVNLVMELAQLESTGDTDYASACKLHFEAGKKLRLIEPWLASCLNAKGSYGDDRFQCQLQIKSPAGYICM